MNKKILFLLPVLVVALLSACSGKDNVAESTMADVAQTIPANARFVMVMSDSLINHRYFKESVLDDSSNAGLTEALDLCRRRPSTIVCFATDDGEIATWPLPSPAEAAEKTAKWTKASLNGAEDARSKVVGTQTVIVSETQIWVVRGKKGVEAVNGALRSAQTSAAAAVPVLRDVVTAKPDGLAGVVRLDEQGDRVRYLALTVSLGSRSLDIAGEMKNADGSAYTFGDVDQTIDAENIRHVAGDRAFIALYAHSGMLSEAVRSLADFAGDYKARIALNTVAPMFDKAEGPVIVALGKDNILEVSVTFATTDDAEVFRADMGALSAKFGLGMELNAGGNVVVIRRPLGRFDFDINIGALTDKCNAPVSSCTGLAEGRISAMGYDLDLRAAVTSDGGTLRISTPTEEQFDDLVGMLIALVTDAD